MIGSVDALYILGAMLACAASLATWILLTRGPVEDEPPTLDTRNHLDDEIPTGALVPLDEVTPAQLAEDMAVIKTMDFDRVFKYANNVVLPSGRSWRLDRFR